MPRRVLSASLVLLGICPLHASADPAEPAPTPDDVRALVSEMLADAQTRSSLLAPGDASGGAGHDGRFFLASADGRFRLNISGQMQTRYTLNFRNPDQVVNNDDFESGFSLPRTRVAFDGTVQDPRLFYRVMLDFRATSGDGFLQDAWAGYNFEGGWTVRVGQGITQFLREWNMGDFKMLTPERSIQSYIFGQFRSKFLDLKYQTDDSPLRAVATFSDGFRSANTDWDNSPAEFALTGRAELKWAGAWKQLLDDIRSPRGSAYAGVVGAAVHYEQAPDVPGESSQSLLAWTADILTKGDGWSLMAAGVGYIIEGQAGVPGADFNDNGFLVQGGIHVTDDIELVARYDVILPDHDRADNDPFNTITLGFNDYIYGQALKFSVAVMWYLDDTQGTEAGYFGGAGARHPTSATFGPLPSAEAGQVTAMFQMQVLF